MRALYVDAHLNPDISIHVDGPSLLVTETSKADRRYPFSRLSHIMILGNVQLDLQVIYHCMKHHIPIILQEDKHHILGVCQHAEPVISQSSIMESLEQCLLHKAWHEAYEAWKSSIERYAILQLGKDMHIYWQDFRPDAVRKQLRSLPDMQNIMAMSQIEYKWEALLYAQVIVWLENDGISEVCCARLDGNLRPAYDITHQLFWDFYHLASKNTNVWEPWDTADYHQKLMAVFENQLPRIRKRYLWLMRRFDALIKRMQM